MIDMAKQMGLIQMSYNKNLPNASKCNTIQDAFKSHTENNQKAVVKLSDMYGMLALLGLGLGLALIALFVEVTLLVRKTNDKYEVAVSRDFLRLPNCLT